MHVIRSKQDESCDKPVVYHVIVCDSLKIMEPKPIVEIAHNLGILLMNGNSCAIFFFSSILVMSFQISIISSIHLGYPKFV